METRFAEKSRNSIFSGNSISKLPKLDFWSSFGYSPQVRNEPKKPSFFPVVRAVVQVGAWKFQAACRTQKSICMPNIKWIGLEIWKLDKKFYWNFWFQFYAEVRQGLLLTFKGLLEPWYSNPVFNSLKTHLIPNFIKIRPHLAKWERSKFSTGWQDHFLLVL